MFIGNGVDSVCAHLTKWKLSHEYELSKEWLEIKSNASLFILKALLYIMLRVLTV